MDLKSIVEQAIIAAEAGKSKLPDDFPTEHSLSGFKGRALINNICSNEGIRYVEVGSYAGSTFCSALCGNSIDATACDIWEQFIEQPRASIVKKLFFDRTAQFSGDNEIHVVQKNIYESETAKIIGPDHNFYFFDGDHTADATEGGIIRMDPCMSDEFILMVDDYAMISTRSGVESAIRKMGYEILFWKELGSLEPYDWYTQVPQRMAGEPDWWCNYLIAVLRKSHKRQLQSVNDYLVNIVTVCSRPENLVAVKESIYKRLPDNAKVIWHIIIDSGKVSLDDQRIPHDDNVMLYSCSEVGPGAGLARNLAFDNIKDGYIHIVDDDNIVHPNFYTIMSQVVDRFPEHVIVGDQVTKNGSLRLSGVAENMRRCNVDSASIAWHAKIMGDIRWQNVYECDGIFVEEIFQRQPEKFVFVHVPISYYNYLKP